MNDLLPRVLLFFSVVVLSFAYGFISHRQEIFPYQLIHEAFIAFNAVLEVGEQKKPRGLDFFEDAGINELLARKITSNAGEEKIFILGSRGRGGWRPSRSPGWRPPLLWPG